MENAVHLIMSTFVLESGLISTHPVIKEFFENNKEFFVKVTKHCGEKDTVVFISANNTEDTLTISFDGIVDFNDPKTGFIRIECIDGSIISIWSDEYALRCKRNYKVVGCSDYVHDQGWMIKADFDKYFFTFNRPLSLKEFEEYVKIKFNYGDNLRKEFSLTKNYATFTVYVK